MSERTFLILSPKRKCQKLGGSEGLSIVLLSDGIQWGIDSHRSNCLQWFSNLRPWLLWVRVRRASVGGCGVAHLIGCGVAQLETRRDAVRRPWVRISARHPSGGPLPELTAMRKLERNSTKLWMKCVVYECMCNEEKRIKNGFVPPKTFKTFFGFIEDTMTKTGDGIYYRSYAID